MSREAAVLWAHAQAGLVADPAGFARYVALIASGETPERQREMAVMSGCGLFGRAYLAAMLARPAACLLPPYVTSRALEDLEQVARAAGAIRPGTTMPTPGDLVHLGAGPGGPEHLWVCVGQGVGVEGGQRVRGHEAVLVRLHDLVDGHDDTGAGRRPALGVYDLDALAAAFGWAEIAEPDP